MLTPAGPATIASSLLKVAESALLPGQEGQKVLDLTVGRQAMRAYPCNAFGSITCTSDTRQRDIMFRHPGLNVPQGSTSLSKIHVRGS